MNQYNIDWKKTRENINFILVGKTNKDNFHDVFCVTERTAQKRLQENEKELSIRDLLILADYCGCEIHDLLIFAKDTYVSPDPNWREEVRKIEKEHVKSEEILEQLNVVNKRKEKFEIRNLAEFLLYFPLIKEAKLRDAVYRCYNNLTYDRYDYVLSQMSILYQSIPDSQAKRDADEYRDHVLRVKGVPGNNLFGLDDKEYNKAYWLNLIRFLKEGNSDLKL